MDSQIKCYLKEYGYESKYKLEEQDIECKISLMQLRDGLLRIGHILEENIDEKIYVVSIKAGKLGVNNAVIVCKLSAKHLYLVGYAREGLLKQNTCIKAMKKIGDMLDEL